MHEKPSAAADSIWSLLWILLGAAIVYGAWTMDRLEAQHINPYTVPGLVPGILGAGLVTLGLLLFARSARAGGLSRRRVLALSPRVPLGRVALALVLCLGYGAGLVGRGLPFWLATFLFVFVAIVAFQWPERRARGDAARGALVALACAAGTAAGVTVVFQEIFLVRLP
jgi:hypothetical protein